MTTPNRPPLWEVMTQARFDAYRKATGLPPEEEYAAAEIRALRDWLVPVDENGDPIGYLTCAQVEDRLWIRSILTTEADRAERGDHA